MSACDILTDARHRYKKLLPRSSCYRTYAENSTHADQVITQVRISTSGGCETYPSLTSSERYKLTIARPAYISGKRTNFILLSGDTVWGIIRGLETLNQLVYTTGGDAFVRGIKIDDSPRFAHRGLLIDTARHFIPVPTIIQNLEMMSLNKMNVFHWHIVDDQSFPYESSRFPALSKEGAFSSNQTYTSKDVEFIIEYARFRGIRVIVEFDIPGHTSSFGKAYPQLLINAMPEYRASRVADFTNCTCPMNVTSPSTIGFLTQFFNEIAEVFPDSYIHTGGDEVKYDCCIENPNLSEYMNFNGPSLTSLTAAFIEKTNKLLRNVNKKSIVWQEAFEMQAHLSADTIIEVWKDWGSADVRYWLNKITNSGFRVIVTGKSAKQIAIFSFSSSSQVQFHGI